MKRCDRCARYFEPRSKHHRLCSSRCRNTYWNARKPHRIHKKRRCEECGHWYQPKHDTARYCGTRCSQLAIRNRRRRLRKNQAVVYKGGRCQRCGYKKCTYALEFHHRTARYKESSASNILDWQWSVLKRELDKCDLLCANCHRELHRKDT